MRSIETLLDALKALNFPAASKRFSNIFIAGLHNSSRSLFFSSLKSRLIWIGGPLFRPVLVVAVVFVSLHISHWCANASHPGRIPKLDSGKE